MQTHVYTPESEQDAGSPGWLITYADTVTIVLAFFVLLVSMSHVEYDRFRQALAPFGGSVRQALQAATTPVVAPAPRRTAVGLSDFQTYLREQEYGSMVTVLESRSGVEIVLQEPTLFADGVLSPRGLLLLGELAGLITADFRTITVEGHTSTENAAEDPWMQTSRQATQVVQALLQVLGTTDVARFSAVGCGAYRPIDANETARGRARNRRIEIMLSW